MLAGLSAPWTDPEVVGMRYVIAAGGESTSSRFATAEVVVVAVAVPSSLDLMGDMGGVGGGDELGPMAIGVVGMEGGSTCGEATGWAASSDAADSINGGKAKDC